MRTASRATRLDRGGVGERGGEPARDQQATALRGDPRIGPGDRHAARLRLHSSGVIGGGRQPLTALYPRGVCLRGTGHSRDEVRRHLGRRRRADQTRRAADRRRPRRAANASSRCSRRAARRPTNWSPQAHEISDRPVAREMDMLLSTGERISCALCAMAIHDMGHEAISLTGSQAGIVTDPPTPRRGSSTCAPTASARRWNRTGSSSSPASRASRPTVATSPRSGAAAPTPPRWRWPRRSTPSVCEIYTDVRGVYSADPRIVPDARKLDQVSFEEMLEMAASGAGVLQLRSVEYARNHGVRIYCRSSFEDGPGTLVVSEEETMEQPFVTAVTHSDAEARVTLTGSARRAGRRGSHLQRAGRRQRERRRDHPERAGRGRPAGRPLLHRRPRRAAAGARGDRRARRRLASR